MRRRPSLLPLLLAAAGALSLGGCNKGAQKRCSALCDALDACGLLPSPLGAEVPGASTVDNCRARCENTPDLSADLADCAQDVVERVGDVSERHASASDRTGMLWCDVSQSRVPMCVKLSSCVEDKIDGDERLLGRATLHLMPVRDAEMDFSSSKCRVERGRNDSAADGGMPRSCCGSAQAASSAHTFVDPEAQCRDMGEPFVSFFVDQEFVRLDADVLPCDQALTDGELMPELSAGIAVGGVKLQGQIPLTDTATRRCAADDEGCLNYCWVFYTPAIVLKANQDASVAVRLPTLSEMRKGSISRGWATCEGDERTCQDDIDNDHDGDVDCADIECAQQPFCREQEGKN